MKSNEKLEYGSAAVLDEPVATPVVGAPDRSMVPAGVAPMAGTLKTGDALVREVEDGIQTIKRLIVAALHMTKSHDWQDFGGKPYLEGEGALRMLAVGVKCDAPTFETKSIGEDWFCKCSIRAEWPFMGQVVYEIGSCNTRDKFFSNDSEGSQINKIRRQCDGNESLARRCLKDLVEKKALMNAYSRAITAVMGIRGWSWDDLEECGLLRGEGAVVGFKKGVGDKATRPKANGGGKRKSAPVVDGDLALLLAADFGSVVRFEAAITGVEQRGEGNIARMLICVNSGDAVAQLIWWTDRPLADLAAAGIEEGAVRTFTALVKDWEGRRQYTIVDNP